MLSTNTRNAGASRPCMESMMATSGVPVTTEPMAPERSMKVLPSIMVMIMTMTAVLAFLAKRMMSGVNITAPTA